MIKLFDIQNGVLIPTEHCYALKVLKDIMDTYPDDYMKVYQYLFYMSCPNPVVNPFFDVSDHTVLCVLVPFTNAVTEDPIST